MVSAPSASLSQVLPGTSTTGERSASRLASGIWWLTGSSPTYVVHSGLPYTSVVTRPR